MKTFRLLLLVLFAFAAGIGLERFGAITSRAQNLGTADAATTGLSADGDLAAGDARSRMATLSDPSEDTESEDPKRFEDEVKKRAAYLASLVDDVKRLDRGAIPAGNDEISERKIKRGQKLAIGGGERREHAYYHFSGSSLKEETNEADGEAVIELSPLLQIDANLAKFAATPVGSPVLGEITSGFGYRASPFERGRQLHEGVDFAADLRTPVLATADGIVTLAGPKNGYGTTVIIQHKDGVETLYGHLSRATVIPGARVCRGQQLGFVGMTGHTTGPHVHYEVRINGVARDPMRYVQLGGLVTAFAEMIDRSEPETADSSIG